MSHELCVCYMSHELCVCVQISKAIKSTLFNGTVLYQTRIICVIWVTNHVCVRKSARKQSKQSSTGLYYMSHGLSVYYMSHELCVYAQISKKAKSTLFNGTVLYESRTKRVLYESRTLCICANQQESKVNIVQRDCIIWDMNTVFAHTQRVRDSCFTHLVRDSYNAVPLQRDCIIWDMNTVCVRARGNNTGIVSKLLRTHTHIVRDTYNISARSKSEQWRSHPLTPSTVYIYFMTLMPVAGLIFETKNRAIFLERFFWRHFSGEKLLPVQLCSH